MPDADEQQPGTRPGQVPRRRWARVHAWPVRLTHWLNAAAILGMLMSGWGIYNASPLFGFRFPTWATLGGWLGGAIAWHLAAMWLLVANAVLYLLYGLCSGHLRRALLPLSPTAILRDMLAAFRFRLPHSPGHYNAVQRACYLAVLLCGALAVASGLAIWKPVQLQELTALLGGYEFARRVHFIAMAGIFGFVVLHLLLVALVPSTLLGMLIGRQPPRRSGGNDVPPQAQAQAQAQAQVRAMTGDAAAKGGEA